MEEMAQSFVGRECIIYLLEGQVDGNLVEVRNNTAVIEKDGNRQIVNLDYVVRIREYPTNKKGKKASLVLD